MFAVPYEFTEPVARQFCEGTFLARREGKVPSRMMYETCDHNLLSSSLVYDPQCLLQSCFVYLWFHLEFLGSTEENYAPRYAPR